MSDEADAVSEHVIAQMRSIAAHIYVQSLATQLGNAVGVRFLRRLKLGSSMNDRGPMDITAPVLPALFFNEQRPVINAIFRKWVRRAQARANARTIRAIEM